MRVIYTAENGHETVWDGPVTVRTLPGSVEVYPPGNTMIVLLSGKVTIEAGVPPRNGGGGPSVHEFVDAAHR